MDSGMVRVGPDFFNFTACLNAAFKGSHHCERASRRLRATERAAGHGEHGRRLRRDGS